MQTSKYAIVEIMKYVIKQNEIVHGELQYQRCQNK